MELLLNVDVDDLEDGIRFYREALGLEVGRRFDSTFVELVGGSSRIYLLEKKSEEAISPQHAALRRSYQRHWTPVHLDFVVTDIGAALERALEARARSESPVMQEPYGKLALLSDPFGHGFCLIEFEGGGYDELAGPPSGHAK